MASRPAKANAVIRVLRILLKFAWDQGLVSANVAERPGLISTPARVRIWTPAESEALLAAAETAGLPSIGDALLLGLYSGQRQGDLLRLTWDKLEGGRLTLQQRKTGARVAVPLVPRLASRLDEARARGAALLRDRKSALLQQGQARRARQLQADTVLLCELTFKPWDRSTFRHRFGALRNQAAADCPSIADAWVLDLRDTAVTRLAEAGCTIPEICAITGHSERSAYAVLKHHMALTGDMADNAIAKLVKWEERREAKGEGL